MNRSRNTRHIDKSSSNFHAIYSVVITGMIHNHTHTKPFFPCLQPRQSTQVVAAPNFLCKSPDKGKSIDSLKETEMYAQAYQHTLSNPGYPAPPPENRLAASLRHINRRPREQLARVVSKRRNDANPTSFPTRWQNIDPCFQVLVRISHVIYDDNLAVFLGSRFSADVIPSCPPRSPPSASPQHPVPHSRSASASAPLAPVLPVRSTLLAPAGHYIPTVAVKIG